MRFILLFSISALLVGCATPKNRLHTEYLKTEVQLTKGTDVFIKMNAEENVKFLGLVNYDDSGAVPGNMMYPGYTPGLFIASIFAHAIVADSIKNNKKSKIQKQADKILLPYKDILSDFTSADLLEKGLIKLGDNENLNFHSFENEPQSKEWILETSPLFLMTQDEETIILQNAVVIYPENNPSHPVYKNIIEISSLPNIRDDSTNPWLPNNEILSESSDLFTLSLDYATRDALDIFSGEASEEKTFHYYQGGQKHYERGRLVERGDDRMTIRTLRGWLKLVPVDINTIDDVNFE